MLLTLHYSSHMHTYTLYSISSTASLCNTCITSHFNYATLFTYSSHMYILYSISSTASLCNTCIISHFNYATLFTYSSHMYILYSIPSPGSCLCRSVPSLIHISLCTYSLSPYTCVYKTVVLELLVRLLVGYYCIVRTRSISISLHSH